MEDDVDIYADLPSFDLHPEKNDQDCNCKELKKELSSLVSKLEDIQRTKTNLENNLFSLLKTARAEITRKDKMIDDLRKKLDDITFRRSRNSEFLGFSTHKLSHQHAATKKYENVPLTHSQESETESHQMQFYHDECKSRSKHSQENETESHQIQFCHDEYKSGKPPSDVNRISTVFGERLHKRIMEDEKEEEKQKPQLELSVETKTKDISKESIVKNNKKNGSQFSVNNNDNKSNIGRCSNSEPPYSKNLKRTNKEDDKCAHKRMKIENNEDKTIEETDYLTQYDLTDNPAQYEVKDSLIKFEGRLDAAHSFKKEEVPFYDGRRAASEYRDTKQDQDCTNGWRSKAKSNSAKDHESSSVKNGLVDNLRNSRAASTSNHVSERFNSGYKKNESRYSPSRRSYSRSRSDYESSNSHRLRERSSRTYKEKKYDDYKYDNRYKNGRLRRNYESEENDRKTRYRRRERDDLRDKSRYSSSDTEDKESSKSYKNKKYKSHRVKKETVNVLNDKKLCESNKATAETNLRESSSRTIVNSTISYNAGKNIEQHKVKNESEIKSINLTESTSAQAAKEDLDIPEEGEILDSPEKKNNSVKFSEDNKMEEDNVKIVPVGDKNEDISVNASIDDKSVPLQSDTNSTKAANINTEIKIEVASCLLQENSKDYGEIIQLNSDKSDKTIAEAHNCIKDEDKCKPHINEDLIDSTTQNIGIIERVDDSDINSNDKNDADKESKNSITKTAIKFKEIPDSNIESVPKVKELDDSCIESVPKVKELDDSCIESATKKKETSNPNIESVVEATEVNNFNSDDSIHKINDNELRTSAKIVTKVEAMPNCDIEDKDKSQAPIKSSTNQSETSHQMSNKSAVETCLNDHNYVQNPSIDVPDLDAVQKPSLRSERDEAVAKTTTSEETKAEKTISVQSVSVKKTMSSIAKNKKGQHSKGILISHRRKAVILSDSNASMTVLMNTNVAKTSSAVNNCNDNDSTLKPRACKISRVTAKATCK